MGTVVGTNRDDDRLEDSPFVNENDVIFGLKGDDSLFGGLGQDSLFGGPGNDYLDGGQQIDYYHFLLDTGDDHIDELESLPGTQNNADRFRFWRPETERTTEAFLDLEHITDAFLVLRGESFTPPTDATNRIETGAFFSTRSSSVFIEDQYGNNDGNTPPAPFDHHDGVEFLNLRYLNFLGNRTNAEYVFNENEDEIEQRIQRGDGDFNEFFIGSRGDDSIFGNNGQDVIFSGSGDDSVFGGNGIDHLHASRGMNLLDGGNSADYYYWNREFRATNTIREQETSSDDMIAADFSAADLNRAVAESSNDDLVLGFAKASNLSRETSTFRLQDQFSQDLMLQGYDIEFIRFAGKIYNLQQDFQTNGTNEGELIAMSESGGDRIRAGGGDDLIFGNGGKDNIKGQDGDDIINGGALDDKIWGGGGDDLLRGGAKADLLNGGGGDDTADYRTSLEGVRVDLSQGRQKGGDAAGDRLRGIENVTGSERNDDLKGDGGGNEIRGRSGADKLTGRGGGDDLYGDAGADMARAGGGRDDVWGGGGNDRLWGDGANDRIWTGSGADRAWGGGGDDRIWGGGGRDKLWGNAGDDTFYGSAGNDTYYVGPGDDRIVRYADNRDKIAFSGPDRPGSFSDLRITQSGDDALVRWDGGSVRIDDTDEGQLTRSDFLL